MRFTSGVIAVFLLSVGACGGESDRQAVTQTAEVDSSTITPENAPAVVERQGRSYLRRDLWTDEEYQRILRDAVPTEGTPTVAQIAARLRTHVLVGGVYYIEAEPNLEMAEAVSRGESRSTPPGIPREPRTVLVVDGRVHSTSPQTYPHRTIAFQNTGCTATKVGRWTMITAAHCIYSNNVDQFKCVSGTASGGVCASGWPEWRFGTEDGTGFGNFFGSTCGWQGVTSEYVALDGSLDTAAKQWTSARYDFGFIDLTGCTEYTTGWLGTSIASDSELLNMEGHMHGYPRYAPCPDGVGVGNSLDCGPGTTNYRYNGDTSNPYSGAEIWGMSSTNVSAGPAGYAADTIQSDIDLTSGQSGSALWFLIAPNDRRAVGVTSIHRQSSISSWNGFSRFTAAKYNWLAANSPYPEDTL